MKTMRRRICWLAVCVFVAAIAAVPLLALVNGRWASEAALGDVVISYDNVVRFYDNATGGEKDFNVPLLGSEQMYQALRSLGVESELVIYPNQYHGITTPSYKKDRLERYVAWYDKFLKTTVKSTN